MKLSKLIIALASALGLIVTLLFGATGSYAAVSDSNLLTAPGIVLQSDGETSEEEGGEKKKEEEEEPDC